ncbi:hypothetical protein BDF22DRAFT_668240 [Syncephalis plumigaleata]|nr:hypothetical protein BDF22DRAFT_668240 [Syncephalis plumigaleata]
MSNPRKLLAQSVKQHLRRLLFRVHPDYFQNTLHKKYVNESSLQQLQQLLAPALASSPFPSTTSSNTSLTTSSVSVTFHVRDMNTLPATAKQTKEAKQHDSIQAHFTSSATSYQIVSTFFDLCRKADITPTNEAISLLDTLKTTDTDNNTAASSKGHRKHAALTIRQEFERGLRAHMTTGTTPLGNDRSSNDSLVDLLQIYILPEISTEQATIAYQRLGQFIKEYPYQIANSNDIIHHQWWQLPILVGSAYTRDRPGFICVPFDLNYTDFKQYLMEHGNDIRNESTYRQSK